MSNQLVALLFGAGVGAWVYSQMMRRTNVPKTSLYTAIGAGIVAAFVIYTIFASFFQPSSY